MHGGFSWHEASRQRLKILRGSFDQALSPQAFVLRALQPAVCIHGPLFLGRSSLPFASRQRLKILRGSLDHALWPQAFVLGALQPAVCLHGPLFLGRSSLPFASRQRLKILGGSFDQALWPQAFVLRALQPAVAASTRNSGHRPLFLQPCSLPFALMALCSWGVQACRLKSFTENAMRINIPGILFSKGSHMWNPQEFHFLKVLWVESA